MKIEQRDMRNATPEKIEEITQQIIRLAVDAEQLGEWGQQILEAVSTMQRTGEGVEVELKQRITH